MSTINVPEVDVSDDIDAFLERVSKLVRTQKIWPDARCQDITVKPSNDCSFDVTWNAPGKEAQRALLRIRREQGPATPAVQIVAAAAQFVTPTAVLVLYKQRLGCLEDIGIRVPQLIAYDWRLGSHQRN